MPQGRLWPSEEEEQQILNLQIWRSLNEIRHERLWEGEVDVFNLRQLFDGEEPLEEEEAMEVEEIDELAQMYAENPRYYRFLLYQNIEEEADSGIEMMTDDELEEEEEEVERDVEWW